MPKVTINGKELEVEAGLNLIDACRKADVDVPHFCYHPALSIAGSCRMCHVEIEMAGRKMVTVACNTKVTEGMKIFTDSEPAKKVQQSIMEFLLLNHPLDCPICDDAGECKLQNYYMKHDAKPSRMGEPKWRKRKVVDLGPNIVLDSERCIQCSRCVRFFREIVKNEQMEIFNNGSKAEIGALPGKTLETDYTGNIVDLCPVGALTDRRFRFKRRVWYLKAEESVCPGCSRGCNIEVHFDPHHNWQDPNRRIQRIKPRYNSDVNKYWLCDAGRYGWDFVDAPNRLTKALMKTDKGLVESKWDDAMKAMAAGLKKAGKNKTAVILAPKVTTGALYLLKKLVDQMGLVDVDYRHPSVEDGNLDHLLQMKDRNPNSFAAKIIGLIPGEGGKSFNGILEGIKSGDIQNLFAICCDPAELLGSDKDALKKLKFFGLMHWTNVVSTEYADVTLPLSTFVETNGTYINYQGRIQRIRRIFEPLGDAHPAWQTILHIGKEMSYKFKALSEAEIFAEFAESTVKYKGLTWDKIGASGWIPEK